MKRKLRPLIYLASPYSHPNKAVVEERYLAVCRAAGEFMRQGHLIYSPIAHTHALAQTSQLPTDFEFWGDFDEAMISRCSELWVLMLDGYDESRGVAEEIAIADAREIPVVYMDAPCPAPMAAEGRGREVSTDGK